jgi:hypothetical protein
VELPGELGGHLAVSLWRGWPIALALALAVPLGLVLGQSPRANRVLAPVIYLLHPIPKVVFVPIILLFFGIGDFPKIFIIFLILFFQVLVLVRDQAAAIRPELVDSVRSLGAGRRALFRFVYLPATLPAVLTALRQSIGNAAWRCSMSPSCSPPARSGLLHLCQQHFLRLPEDVRRGAGDEPARSPAVFRRRRPAPASVRLAIHDVRPQPPPPPSPFQGEGRQLPPPPLGGGRGVGVRPRPRDLDSGRRAGPR